MVSDEAISKQLVATVRHSCSVEFYVNRLNLKLLDHERPHDVFGPNNKLERNILLPLASQYDKDSNPDEVKAAVELHRRQYHHRIWNGEPILAYEGDFLLGAIDAICSMLEYRPYQGGPHSWNKISFFIDRQSHNPKFPWLKQAFPEMMRIGRPNLELIDSPFDFPNIGLPQEVYDAILQRSRETASEYF